MASEEPPATRLPGEGPPPFCRKPMVDWLHPAQLARTAVKVGLSGVFGAYADKRELEAALHPLQAGSPYDADYSAEAGGPFW
ncbi:MAG: metallophosphoesterase, partial [Gaiellales bacterium]